MKAADDLANVSKLGTVKGQSEGAKRLEEKATSLPAGIKATVQTSRPACCKQSGAHRAQAA
jgi:hypothetical protein